ncbi:hypothetical protein F5Y10DRAFT_292062 [Nemania abortiva]|nr:hypothetical protein F5Y10DRAFT_292062 [Nemania abortiva]
MRDSVDETSESRTLLEAEPLESSERKLGAGFTGLGFSHKRRRTYSHLAAPIAFHLLLATLYTALFFMFWDSKLKQGIVQASGRNNKYHAYSKPTTLFFCLKDNNVYKRFNMLITGPALEALKWESRVFEGELDASSPFKGPPRPELDDAWNNLLGPTAIRVDKEALDRINRTSVPLRDGSGYMATLDVYHQLHCLVTVPSSNLHLALSFPFNISIQPRHLRVRPQKYIRRYLNQDYYNMSEPNLEQHIDHCLDGLRQYVMCNADVVLLTYDWIPNYSRPWPNFGIRHECASWDAIDEWARKHSFDGFDDNLIKHPDFHPEMPSPFDYLDKGGLEKRRERYRSP